MPDERSRPARVSDAHELARAMPHVTVYDEDAGNPVYQVGGKSFIFFRNRGKWARSGEHATHSPPLPADAPRLIRAGLG